ncbi:hypothetical protein E2C01_027480 [Portunus trituberculatus]|uniref:Uncharacterized protein n=1 Tax=Portunus trituberculatus TaxID=210409 RepID=A0A5B7EIU3_PORTR|nr:hypothetical protein [Portunus trituberculatus]
MKQSRRRQPDNFSSGFGRGRAQMYSGSVRSQMRDGEGVLPYSKPGHTSPEHHRQQLTSPCSATALTHSSCNWKHSQEFTRTPRLGGRCRVVLW